MYLPYKYDKITRVCTWTEKAVLKKDSAQLSLPVIHALYIKRTNPIDKFF